MKAKSLWYLEDIDLTNILCPIKLKNGALDTRTQKVYKKGTYIYFPEEQADKIYFIMEGSVKIGKLGKGGKELTKTILSKGEVFGELALVGISQRKDFAFVVENATLCIISVPQMKSLMRKYTQLQVFIMRILGNRILDMEQRLESLVFKDSRTRIIEYLLNQAKKKGQRIGYETIVRKMLTHQEISNFTATSRQTVTTVLNELREKNILTFNRKRLLIRDLDKLAAEGKL